MTTIQLQSKITEDGILLVKTPPELKGLEVNITITTVETKTEDIKDKKQAEWLNFLGDITGLINDETFIRQPQPKLDIRENLE